jgi:outer membrane protein assembly factor BamB
VSERFLPLVIAVLLLGAFTWWVCSFKPDDVRSPRIPGADRSAPRPPPPIVDLRGTFTKGPGQAARLPGAWPQFRGPNFDNIVRQTPPLAKTFPEDGPPVLWSLKVGDGYASPSILNGRAYLLDYDEENLADVLRCLSPADGREIWRRAYHVKVKRYHGMSRTMPAVSEKCVVTIGPKCHVLCVEAQSGEFLWGIDLVREYETKVPEWYTGQCPIFDGDKLILAPAGKDVLLMAVDLATGKPIWKTPNHTGWNMTHTSVLPWTFGEKKTYLYCASGGVVMVSAETGEVLWQTHEWKVNMAAVATPVPAGPGRILFTGGYNAGSLMLRFKEENGKIVHETVFRKRARECGSDQQTPLFHEGHLYLVVPKPSQQMICMTPDGELKWTSGTGHRFGIGPYLIADGMIFVMDNNGVLTLAEATPEAFKPLGQWKILDSKETWGPLVLVDGRLFARGRFEMVCLDVRAK